MLLNLLVVLITSALTNDFYGYLEAYCLSRVLALLSLTGKVVNADRGLYVAFPWLTLVCRMSSRLVPPLPRIIDFGGQGSTYFTTLPFGGALQLATMEVGAVAAMRYFKDGIKAAKLVMEYTEYTLLVGEQASLFGISMGLPGPMNLSSPESLQKWIKWKENNCQPNFRKNTFPANSCGLYHPKAKNDIGVRLCSSSDKMETATELPQFNIHNHDTISMAVIDKLGHIAVGTSTNGATFKIPGRVGDCPIVGSSAYADDEVGACGATGDGGIMMRFLPCYQVVESMRQGMEPKLAAENTISRIARKFPNFVGAVFAVSKNGDHAGACYGWTFQYSVRLSNMDDVEIDTVTPLTATTCS